MVRSMTGYGRAAGKYGERELTVELRSVNQRGFEFSTRIPRFMSLFEDRLRKLAGEQLTRGKLELSVQLGGEAAVTVTADPGLAQVYVETVRSLGASLSLPDTLGTADLLRLDGLFTVTHTPEDEDVLWAALEPVVKEAIAAHTSMRVEEGCRLCEDVLSRLDTIEADVTRIEIRSPETVAQYRERLLARMQEVLAGANVDQNRILTEAAIYADKVAVDEETVRLRSHIRQFRTLLTENEAVGKKPDFLVQEMGREINTIGSKCADLDITRLVIEMKAEMEKIREQVQNLE